MKTENPKTIEVIGWYAAQYDNVYLYVDKYIKLGKFVTFHVVKDEDDESDYWYNDYEAKDEDLRFYDTIEECKANDEAIINFREAKKEAENEAKKKKFIEALDEFTDENKYKDLSSVLAEADYVYCHCYSESGSWYNNVYKIAAKIYKTGIIEYGNWRITLANVERAIIEDNSITLVLVSGQKVAVDKKNHYELYRALRWMYNLDI